MMRATPKPMGMPSNLVFIIKVPTKAMRETRRGFKQHTIKDCRGIGWLPTISTALNRAVVNDDSIGLVPSGFAADFLQDAVCSAETLELR